jgi:hypothetical protein
LFEHGRLTLTHPYDVAADILLLANRHKRIACAAAPGGVLCQDAMPDQIINVAKRGILRRFHELRPFGGRQLAFEAVKQAIDDAPLPVIERATSMMLPEARLV